MVTLMVVFGNVLILNYKFIDINFISKLVLLLLIIVIVKIITYFSFETFIFDVSKYCKNCNNLNNNYNTSTIHLTSEKIRQEFVGRFTFTSINNQNKTTPSKI